MAVHFHEEDLPPGVLAGTGAIAIDTETMGLITHRDRLCVVQISDGSGTEHLVRFNPGSSYDAPNLKAILGDDAAPCYSTDELGQILFRNAAAQARRIVALETQIAERHWPIADRRDRSRTYNLKTRAEIRALAPNFPWDASFDSAGLGGVQEVVISELSAIAPLANLFMATPVSTWKSYLTYHLVRNNAAVLPSNIDAEVFAFYGTTLSGQPQQRERWKDFLDYLGRMPEDPSTRRHLVSAAQSTFACFERWLDRREVLL